MRRVMIMGPPGSGKSTLALALGRKAGLPVFHLDQLFWRPGWVQAPPDDFAREVERIAARPAWIIEGNYLSTIEPRLRVADTLVYLDMPAWLSTARVLRRVIVGHGRTRPDLAPDCPEGFDLAFLRYVWRWNALSRDATLARIAGFEGRRITVRGRREASLLAGP